MGGSETEAECAWTGSLDTGVSSESESWRLGSNQSELSAKPKQPQQPTSSKPCGVAKQLGKKCRRSYVKKYYRKPSNVNMYTVIGTNCNGIVQKKESLFCNINMFKPSVCLLQETKLTRVGQVKIPSYQIFEIIRQNREGGSLLTAIHENLNPIFISGGENEIEILVVQAEFGSEKCRFINGYGPQENADRALKIEFYARMDQEIKNAKLLGCLVFIEMDSNAKLGCEIIPGDPHPMSQNGEFLLNLIQSNNLVICNADNKCDGLFTHERETIKV